MDSLSKRVRAARLHYKYTQKELSEKCGLSQQSINKLEMARTDVPRQKNLADLASALDVPESWLLFGERPPSWAVDLSSEAAYCYVRRVIPIEGTTDLYTPDSPIGYGHCLIDSERAFGLRVNRTCKRIPYRIGVICAFNPELDPEANDIILLTNSNEKPMIGVLAKVLDEHEYLIEWRNDDSSVILNPSDYETIAVMESTHYPRSYIKVS